MAVFMRTIRTVVLAFGFAFVLHAAYAYLYTKFELVRKASPLPMRWYIQWFIPVYDVKYVYVNDQIDVGSAHLSRVYQYKNPLVGLYAISMYLGNYSFDLGFDPKTNSNYEFKGKIGIKYSIGKKIIFNEVLSGHLSNVTSSNVNSNGFILLFYKVPDDIPPDQEVTLEVTVLEPDVFLERHYGPTYLVVEKMSDL